MTSALAAVVWIGTIGGEHVAAAAHLRWLSLFIVMTFIVQCVFSKRWHFRPWWMVVFLLVGLSGGAWAWHGQTPSIDGECGGVATVISDPTLVSGGTGVVLKISGVRYKAIVHGVAGRRLSQRLAGEQVAVTGMCSQNTGNFARMDAVNHVSGRINVMSVSEEFSEGSAVVRAANRLRMAIVHGVGGMNDELKSLFTGLVMGDDRHQSRQMLQDFRASGLSHLCAVSGQNVAYLLAALSPFLTRLTRWWRWGVTVCLLGWFVVLTRAEPSVLRAAFMALMVATNSLLKLSVNARTVLALTVIALLVIDPMLAWSIGFALSVGATAGLAWCSARLGAIMPRTGVVAATLSAQAGTFPVSLFVFGNVPVISLLANPLALGVAGAVMMCGIPLALFAHAFPPLAPAICVLLSGPVWCVNEVAHVSAHVSPRGVMNWGLWFVVLAFLRHRFVKNAERHSSVAGYEA